MLEKRTCDLAIIGGGLAGGLIALALRRQRPELELLLIESGETFGGNHIWSYFSTDVAPEHRWLTAPLVTHGWSGHEVRFPGHNRTLPDIYYSIESDRFDQVIREQLPERMRVTGVEVASATPTAIALKGHGRIRAGGVIDCRGPADTQALDCGWQKFVGQLVELEQPHGLTHPIIMDATVEQKDGYRFVYCLPFTPTSMFVEDTYYSDKPDLDRRRIAQRIGEYVDAQGWTISRTLREETGVLPVVHGGSLADYWKAGGERTAKAGARAALFHPMTSYSLPDAVRTAMAIAELDDFSGDALHHFTRKLAGEHWRDGGFYRLLGKMLFLGAQPKERYRLFERFYRLSPELITRFYAGQSTATDKIRILSGKPPIPISRALRAILGK